MTDQDPSIANTCREQILKWGGGVRHLLEQTVEEADPSLQSKARKMLQSLDLQEWLLRFAKFAFGVRFESRLPWQQLEEGALVISSLGRDDADSVAAENLARILDSYAAELRPRFEDKSALTCARLLGGYLNNQLGYGGSQSSFYEVSNVHFDKVVAVHRGVPVTLTLLYILVGRRAGLKVTGVAIPDHFLVRVHGARPVLLDPYHDGRQVTKSDCIRYLRIAGYSLHTNSYLEDVQDRQILDCLLRNLLRVYGYREENEFCSVLEKARQILMQA